MWKLKNHLCFQQILRSGFIIGGFGVFFMINCATKLTADVTQSYLNEMLLAVFDYGVVNSLKILQRKKEAAS